ncbi:unnamed protein product [Clavelina lepadiformis]|uniref:Mitochondrial import receptor subunit TOM40 homolog n=1 Tax=Clavelina lepadiformis TaxID=159417 RepID=A0ABP0GTK5_CLALP
MGNAQAASWPWSSSEPSKTAVPTTPSSAPPTVPVEPPPPPPPQSATIQSTPPSIPVAAEPMAPSTSDAKATGKGIGLGTFEELHKPCKDIALMPFDGIKFTVNKGLSSHFQVQHSVTLNNEKSSYKFGSTFVGSKQPSPTEAYPVMVGEMSNEGDLQAQFIHQIFSPVKLKCIAQTSGSKFQSLQIGADIQLKDASISMVTADPNLLEGTGMLVVHYLQAITPKLAMGSELLFQRAKHRQQAMITLAGRYQTKDWQLAATLGMAGLHTSFYRKANENVQVGVEMEASLKTMESVMTLAYQFDLPKMNLLFKGMMTSEWTVGSSLEKKLLPLPITLQLTGSYNIKKDKVSCGIGAVLG